MPDLDALKEWYDSFAAFVKKYDGVYFSELDYYCTRHLNLYALYERPDFAEIDASVQKIRAALPSICRIFGKPIIHLIEREEILPVEFVRYINTKSIDHVASHSELWADVDEEGVKPKKLLSRTYRDNYSIYENVVFANTIDLILSYIRAKVKKLGDLVIYQKLHNVNILDRNNHLDYYIVLGKLHTSYIRNYGRYLDDASSLKDALVDLYQKISGRLHKKVYTCNRNKKIGKLYKTNILSMDKDYKKIYALHRYFDNRQKAELSMQTPFDHPDYFRFCEILLLFSMQHFGFSEEERQPLRFDALDLCVAADRYGLHIKKVGEGEERALLLTFSNDVEYSILLVPVCRSGSLPKNIEKRGADEVIFLSPIPSDNARLVGITELDSFRRLQQILLKGMILSTEKFEVCPFCLGKMKKEEDRERYVCPSCNQVIEKLLCPEKKLPYYNSYFIKMPDAKKQSAIVDIESRMNFRNINRLTAGAYLCPHCKKIH